jgi:hypothetical protein
MEISLESKAISILETYEGFNNYILDLKRKSESFELFELLNNNEEKII